MKRSELIGKKIICPLCAKHEVVIHANKKGKPYLFCNILQVPLNFSTPEAIHFLFEAVEKIQSGRSRSRSRSRGEEDIESPWNNDEDDEGLVSPW